MAEFPERPPVFPYGVRWVEFDDPIVDFGKLTDRDETCALVKFNREYKLGVREVAQARLAELVAVLGLEPEKAKELIDRQQQVLDWYVARHVEYALGQSPGEVRAKFEKIALQAKALYELLTSLDPRSAAVLVWMTAAEPEVLHPDHKLLNHDLAYGVHDLGLAATRATIDMPIKSGAPFKRLRDTVLLLTMRLVEEATDLPVGISRGTKAKEYWHFTNDGGWFIRDLFAELADDSEKILASATYRMRRKHPRGV